MSDLSPAQSSVLQLLGPLDGREIPGGCDRCDAYQTVSAIEAGVFRLTVNHDPDCPELASFSCGAQR